jgi:hypothetical protein
MIQAGLAPLSQPTIGCLCAATSSEDGLWYRAQLLSCSGNRFLLRYIFTSENFCTLGADPILLEKNFL